MLGSKISSSALSKRGFTIVEMLLVIALIGIVGAFMTTIDAGVAPAYRFVRDTEAVVDLIREAQHGAARAQYDSHTGVYIDTDIAVAYVGESYDVRDEEYDRVVPLATPIDATLPIEIHFTSPSGVADERYELHFDDSVRERMLVVELNGLAYIEPVPQ